MKQLQRRRTIALLLMAIIMMGGAWYSYLNDTAKQSKHDTRTQQTAQSGATAKALLSQLPVKGRAPKTDYRRSQFGMGWQSSGVCDTRNIILRRDLTQVSVDGNCKVRSGQLNDPYTGKQYHFTRGANTSDQIQIDHVVSLSNAWQTGAQNVSQAQRVAFANDPLNLLAVNGDANQDKGSSDAASWLPPHKPFRCQYIARQVAIKAKYKLWVTQPEHEAMERVLADCPNQALPQK